MCKSESYKIQENLVKVKHICHLASFHIRNCLIIKQVNLRYSLLYEKLVIKRVIQMSTIN